MRSKAARIALVVQGVLLLVFGYVAWAIEDEYGSATNFLVETRADGTTVVYDVDEQTGTRTEVFEGSSEDAQEYTVERRSEGKSFVFAGSILALGAVLVFLGLRPPSWPRRTRPPDD